MEISAVTGAEALHAVDRLWIVRQPSDGGQAEIDADLGADPVVAQVRGEAEFEVRVDGVQTLVLKAIRLELVEQSGSPAFLGQLKEPSASFGFDHGQRHIRAARHSRIQGNGTYHAGHALGVDPHQYVGRSGTVALVRAGSTRPAFLAVAALLGSPMRFSGRVWGPIGLSERLFLGAVPNS